MLKELTPPPPRSVPADSSPANNQRLNDLYERQNKAARTKTGGNGGDGQGGRGGPRSREMAADRIDYERGKGGRQQGDRNRRDDRRDHGTRQYVGDDNHNFREQRRHEDNSINGGGRHQRGDDDNEATRGQRKFERGDLRNSLRERRAARELTLAKPTLSSFKHPRVRAGDRFTGKITWMYDPGHFYVQRDVDELEFNTMMDDMQREFRSGPFEARTWSKGDPIAAKYQDNCWYRGKVVGQRGKLVDVYFVDFGNTEKVDSTDVLALPVDFGGLETQAMKVGLAGLEEINGKWDKLPNGFADYFTHSSYKVEVVKAGRHVLVELNKGQVANDMLKDLHESKPKTRSEDRLRKNRKENDTSEAKDEASAADKKETVERKKATKVFVAGGDYLKVEASEHLSTSKQVFVSHYKGWKEIWVQVKSLNYSLTFISILENPWKSRKSMKALILFYFNPSCG